MATHLVLGAGAIGLGTAQQLAQQGHRVLLVSRSGATPGVDVGLGIESVALDLAAADASVRLAETAKRVGDPASIVNALNPAYTRWPTDWPPLAAAILDAAERTGAALVTAGNLYGYGRVEGPMVEGQAEAPNGAKGATRSAMWAQARAAHEAGRVRATELRASEYFGPGARSGMSYLNRYIIRPAMAGKTVRLVMGDPDSPHSWTYLPDIAVALAALATADPSAPTWGQVWHAPTGPARSVRQVLTDVATLTGGSDAPRVGMMVGRSLLRRVVPMLRELDETAHQFERPYLLDSAHTEAMLGLAPTPWTTALAQTVTSLGGTVLAHGALR